MAGQLTIGDWDFPGLPCFPGFSEGWNIEAPSNEDVTVISITITDIGGYMQYEIVYSGGGLLDVSLHNCPDENYGADFVCDLPDDPFNHYYPEVVVDPVTTFCDYECPEVPDIDVPTLGYDFGTVSIGTPQTWELVITNAGLADLTVDDVTSDNAVFTEDFAGPQVIAPLGTYTVNVTFTPTDEEVYEGTLTIDSNDPDEDPLLITLDGAGQAGDVPNIVLSVYEHDFGDVEVDTEASFDLIISNDGAADLVLSDIYTDTDEFYTDFSGTVTVAPGADHTLAVFFLPPFTGPLDDVLTIENNDENLFVPLEGLGIAADFYVPENSHNYGEVEIGTTSEWNCVGYNTGNADLIIDDAVIQLEVFDVPELVLPITVVPGDSIVILITFTPDDSDTTFNNTLQLYTNDPATPTMVFLSGTAIEGAPPTAFDLLTPADGSVVETAIVPLSWEAATDPDGGDVAYDLWWATNADFESATIIEDLENTTYDLGGLTDDADYYWRVIARDGNSFGTQCNADFSFSLAIPEPPAAFNLMAPPDGTVIDVSGWPVNFYWLTTTDPDPGDEITYHFYLYDDNDEIVYEDETTENNITVDDPEIGNGDFSWTVWAQDTNTDGTWASQVWICITESVIPGMGVPEDFCISSLYPNPFNPEIHIVYGLPQAADITATIYDLTGRRVAQLNPGYLQPGYHELTWRPDGATGIYFLRMSSNTGWSESRRMIYLK